MIQREIPDADARTDSPVRTCIGCRERELAAELLRLVAVSSGNGQCAVAVDTARRLPGRGAWLHPGTGACRQRSGGELSHERYGSPVHRTPPRWLSISIGIERLCRPEQPGATRPEKQVAKNMSTP